MSDDPAAEAAAWGFVSHGETRWAASASMIAVIVVQTLLPERLTVGPWWLFPAFEAAILIPLIAVNPSRLDAESTDARVIALVLVAILITVNSITLGLLLHHLLRQGDSISGRTLIFSSVAVWFTAVVAYGVLFWEIDRGGPIRRCRKDHPAPDFLFPQMENPATTAKPWTPRFLDYLYVSLTNSTAFSPTDALPLTLRAKAMMAMQSIASIATIVVVGARAVNILK